MQTSATDESWPKIAIVEIAVDAPATSIIGCSTQIIFGHGLVANAAQALESFNAHTTPCACGEAVASHAASKFTFGLSHRFRY